LFDNEDPAASWLPITMNSAPVSNEKVRQQLFSALGSFSWRVTYFLRAAFNWCGGPVPCVTPVAGHEIQQLRGLHSSLSWRLTSPLRLLDRLTGGHVSTGLSKLTRATVVSPEQDVPTDRHPEGRHRQPSIDTICFERVLRPRCAAVTMVRDEAENLPVLMRHLCAIFDNIVVLDHLSSDQTAEIAAAFDGTCGTRVIAMRSEETGMYQADYMTDCARVLIDEETSDWVFFFDADEFLPFASKEQFHQSLVRHANDDVIHYNWINCFSDQPLSTALSGGEVVTADRASGYVKIAINSNRLRSRECAVSAGHHAVRLDGNPQWQVGRYAGGILHFPANSASQLQRKVGNGIESYEALSASSEVGWHYREIAANSDTIFKDQSVLRSLALRYGEPVSDIIACQRNPSRAPLQERNLHLDVALAEAAGSPEVAALAVFDRASLCNKLRSALEGIIEKPSPTTGAVTTTRYGRLPPKDHCPAPVGAQERLDASFLAAVQPLQVLVSSAWAGHEPFLFTLMDLLRPRRYVELGVHEGQSFFAACQHYKSLGGYGEAVGIDLWEGDHQAGFYDDSVFSRFRSILATHFAGCGRYLRSSFSDAASSFDSESIDLLHIDGLHTYEAVSEDYRTWRPKLTADGVILLHDTGEFHSDFGVWQLFEEVKSEATEWFNFRHSHGLGVLAFGDEKTSSVVPFLRVLKHNPVLFERLFALLGQAMHRSRQLDYIHAGDARVLAPGP
jgi:hypothetical protein